MALALFVTSVVFACATISNDNLQDLKTGQLVGASPMRQQIALIVGVMAERRSFRPSSTCSPRRMASPARQTSAW